MPDIVNTVDGIRRLRVKMETSHNRFEEDPNELSNIFYVTKLNIYRDVPR